MASRKNTDSRPSRATAKNTMAINAEACPVECESAESIEAWSSDLIERAALRIQKTIEHKTITAIRPTMRLEKFLRLLRKLVR